jgi:hypothetical protein
MYHDLTKWPRLLVSGKTVTPAQADEILVRTCVPDYLRGNDPEWAAVVGKIMGFNLGEDWPKDPEIEKDPKRRMAWYRERWAARDARMDELGIFGGEYLHTSRIASSYICGPHGWCDWDGRIYCDNYNIGKWPSTEEVTTEWTAIAEAFPFLDLTSQLISEEGDGELAGEWRVKDGTAVYVPEFSPMLPTRTPEQAESAMQAAAASIAFGWTDRERGVSAERLAMAVLRVEAKMRKQRS